MKYIKLHLEAFLQSYGTENAGWYEYRDTSLIPTKSALVGLIACAKGLRKEDEGYTKLNDFEFKCDTSNSINQTTLIDFQVIRPNKFKNKELYFLNPLGGKKEEQFTIEKHYLCNASFDIYVGSESPQELTKIYNSLRYPKWAYYLGRACCTPSQPIITRELEILDRTDLPSNNIISLN